MSWRSCTRGQRLSSISHAKRCRGAPSPGRRPGLMSAARGDIALAADASGPGVRIHYRATAKGKGVPMTTLELTTGTTRRPKMTAGEAVSFERFSLTNAAILAGAAAARGCECGAYTDWFTYNSWTAQGQQVQRGEHGG